VEEGQHHQKMGVGEEENPLKMEVEVEPYPIRIKKVNLYFS
jgi:hypothetical protein